MIKNYKNKLLVIFLVFFSILFNQYYGYVGILPIDSFLIFNSGYDLMSGYYPFKDYWTIKEPFIDFLQAIFFKVLGVSWFSYVFHLDSYSFPMVLRWLSNGFAMAFYGVCKDFPMDSIWIPMVFLLLSLDSNAFPIIFLCLFQ